MLRDQLRLARLRDRLQYRPNHLHATVQVGETHAVRWCTYGRSVFFSINSSTISTAGRVQHDYLGSRDSQVSPLEKMVKQNYRALTFHVTQLGTPIDVKIRAHELATLFRYTSVFLLHAHFPSKNVWYLTAHLEYFLELYDDAERSIVRALELGYTDDGSMQIRLARIHVRRQKAESSNSQRHLLAALASFSEALKFKAVASNAVHYLEVRLSLS